MAEILVYDKDHQLDKYSAESVSLFSARDKENYDRRYQRGDIIHIRPDGYYRKYDKSIGDDKKHGWNQKAFSVISIPEVDPKTISGYRCPEITDGKITKKSTYKVRLDLLLVSNKFHTVASLDGARIEVK